MGALGSLAFWPPLILHGTRRGREGIAPVGFLPEKTEKTSRLRPKDDVGP